MKMTRLLLLSAAGSASRVLSAFTTCSTCRTVPSQRRFLPFPLNQQRTSLFSTSEAATSLTTAASTATGAAAPTFPPMSQLVGVIFDMDGTLVQPCIDFADMRRRIYQVATEELGSEVTEGCVLELESNMSPPYRKRAKEIFSEIEAKAIEDMAFMEGMDSLCRFLDSQGIRRAVLTRNVENSVHAMHQRLEEWHGVPRFSPAVARDTTPHEDDGTVTIPAKPAPDAIWYICQQWKCDPSQVVMVGDSANDDVVAAYRAGCGASVLLQDPKDVHDNNSGNESDSEHHERTPTLTIPSLVQLRGLLERNLQQAQ